MSRHLRDTTLGWVIQPVYLHYQSDVHVSRTLPVGGFLVANLDAISDAALLGESYTFKEPLAGAWYSRACLSRTSGWMLPPP